MTKARWYRGFDNSPDGGVDRKARGEATRRMNREYRERQYRERNVRDGILPPVREQASPPRPYRPDPRNQRPRPMRPGDYTNGPVIDNQTGRRVPPPRSPYASPKRGGLPVTLGRRLKRFRLPVGNPYLDLIETAISQNQDPWAKPGLPFNYKWCAGPTAWPILVGGRQWAHNPYFRNTGSCILNFPVSGQVASNGLEAADPWYGVTLGAPRCYWWNNYTNTVSIPYRGASVGAIERQGASLGAAQPKPYRPYYTRAFVNPNTARFARSDRPSWMADPWEMPRAEFDMSPMANNPEAPYVIDKPWQWSSATGSTATGPASNYPETPVKRAPPTHGEKQRKLLTRTAKIGIALYKALDSVSESSEVVDAVYDALPEDVRKRWPCADQRRGDSFGQYGFGNSPCKARAVYYNAHRLDVEQAVKNIIKNELQDQAIGFYQKVLPKNSGNAHAEAEKKVAKYLDYIFQEELGL